MRDVDDLIDGVSTLTHLHFYLSPAHGPRGTQANQCIYVYRFHPTDGSMVLLNKFGDKSEVMNPAFSRFHPRLDVVCKYIIYALKDYATTQAFICLTVSHTTYR
jgi:hypothetical protein